MIVKCSVNRGFQIEIDTPMAARNEGRRAAVKSYRDGGRRRSFNN